MAGILDWLDAPPAAPSSVNAGILAAPTTNRLGILGATLRDIGANLDGHPADATNLAPIIQQNRVSQLMAAMTSTDPSVRQNAYTVARAMGVDPSAYQKAAAASAMPSLMANMQPQANLDTPIVTPSPVLDPAAYKAGLASGAYKQPATVQPSLTDALAATKNPELTAQMAPDVIKQQLDKQAKAVRTLTPQELQSQFGIDPSVLPPGTIPQVDADGNVKFIKGGDLKSQGAVNQQIDLENRNPNLPIARANLSLAQQRLQMDQAKQAAGIPDDATLHDMATRYVGGDRQVAVGMSRNPAVMSAFQRMISQVGQERGLSQDQISKNLQTFGAGTKAVQAFDTGKQGDTVRSLNVSVSHLETLRNLGQALQNGDVRIVNAAKQKFAEEFGVPAPTNFDAAKSIVADEVAKGVIGGQSAQSDRETLAASLRRSGGPEAINGAISTFQDLLGGQLRGLRQQYKSSTSRDDFNDKLFPETLSVLDPPKKAAPVDPQSLPRIKPPGTVIRYDAQGNRL